MTTISEKSALQDLGSIVESAWEHGEPFIIGRENGDSAVVISLGDFKEMDESEYFLSSPENANRLLTAVDNHKWGINMTERKLVGSRKLFFSIKVGKIIAIGRQTIRKSSTRSVISAKIFGVHRSTGLANQKRSGATYPTFGRGVSMRRNAWSTFGKLMPS